MKKQKLIVAAVLICGIILCIWGANILHNSSKQEETVSSEESSTTSTTAYQTETTTQTTTQADTEEAYFEEDTEEEVQIENAVKELVKDAGKTSPEGEKAVQCYIRFLQDNYAKYYDIADIDGDGIPEFFVLNPNSSAAMYRYNAKKDKVKKLHSYQLGRASVKMCIRDSANADMSNDNASEKLARRKTKVSCATLIDAGLVGP